MHKLSAKYKNYTLQKNLTCVSFYVAVILNTQRLNKIQRFYDISYFMSEYITYVLKYLILDNLILSTIIFLYKNDD